MTSPSLRDLIRQLADYDGPLLVFHIDVEAEVVGLHDQHLDLSDVLILVSILMRKYWISAPALLAALDEPPPSVIELLERFS